MILPQIEDDEPRAANRRAVPLVQDAMQDLRDAFRALRISPIVSAVAVLSLALGIGANTAIFSILNSLMLRTLPVSAPERLAMISAGDIQRMSWTNPIWEQIRDRDDLFDGAFAWTNTRFDLSRGGQTEFVDGLWASGGYFEVLGVNAILGRTFGPADDARRGGPDGAVAVISYSFWQRRYAGAADAVGRSIEIQGVPFTIVGVTPPEFFGTEVGRTFDVAIPIGTEPLIRGKDSTLDRRSTWWLSVMARLRPDQSPDAATAALRGIQPQIREATMPEHYRPEDRDRYLTDPFDVRPASTGASMLRSRYEQPLALIMGVVGLVLLIACANIANLLLARASARRHETSVRLALGASRLRLVRQFHAESLLLSGLGAMLGLLFAHWGSQLLVAQLSTSTTRVFLDLTLDWRVLAFTSGVAIATAILFGIAPALTGTRVQPGESLKEQGRGNSTGRRLSPANLLVMAQVALSLVLLVAAGLFTRTFTTLTAMDPGFQREGLLLVSVNAQPLAIEPAARLDVYQRVRETALQAPGVTSAALSAVTPVSGSTWNNIFEFPGGPERSERDRVVNINYVSPDFFKTFGTRLIAGRDFASADRAGAPDVVIVNESFARKYFEGENPVGRRVVQPGFNNRPTKTFEIVGYVEDSVYRSLREPMSPTAYLPLLQLEEPSSFISLSVRAGGGAPALLIRPLADALGQVDSRLGLTFRPLEEQVDASLTQERTVALLSGFFGVLALLLAGLGLYGVTSYAVSQRHRELGIRMALGAAPQGVVSLVLKRVGLLLGAGVALGIGLSLLAARAVQATLTTLLHGLEPHDPLTLAVAAFVLALIGTAAGWIPALRASRIDPASVLRS
jgi:putative ABC transport system permease protein